MSLLSSGLKYSDITESTVLTSCAGDDGTKPLENPISSRCLVPSLSAYSARSRSSSFFFSLSCALTSFALSPSARADCAPVRGILPPLFSSLLSSMSTLACAYSILSSRVLSLPLCAVTGERPYTGRLDAGSCSAACSRSARPAARSRSRLYMSCTRFHESIPSPSAVTVSSSYKPESLILCFRLSPDVRRASDRAFINSPLCSP